MERKKLLLNDGWKFALGEYETTPVIGKFDSYMHSKAKNGRGVARATYYDGDFETVHLPHDYVIAGDVDSKFNETAGSLERKTAWYRRHFKLPCDIDGSRVVLLFDGAGQKTTVWCNGHLAGENSSMYNSFYMDITPYLLDDSMQTISVKIENEDLEGWWYEGAGIYRDVWLIVTNDIAVDVWGTYVNPVKTSDNDWSVNVETTIYSAKINETKATVVQTLFTDNGEKVIESKNDVIIKVGENKTNQMLSMVNPVLWDLKSCAMYKMQTEIFVEKELIDSYQTDFGFRTIKFDGINGFYLNDTPVKIQGVCMHQDHADLGVAVPKKVQQYRIDKLKSVGINGYRCAHNNTAPEVLDICDRSGMLVIDENRWFNWSERTQKEVESMLKRDRNHPCVIVWSIGNEEPLQSTITGRRLTETLSAFVKRYDDTRPVTLALNGGFFDSYAAEASDVVGVNYVLHLYDQFSEAHPNKCILATESGAASNNRGVYFIEKDENRVGGYYSTAYDEKVASFSSPYIEAIEASETHSNVGGTFMWTGMEYRGEALWPKLYAGGGMFDSCGFEKDNAGMVRACWLNEPVIHIMPHWNFEEEGKMINVVVYTNTEEVELFVNGKLITKSATGRFNPLKITVPYESGEIFAIGYNNGEKVVEQKIETTGNSVKFIVENETPIVTDSGEDVAILRVYTVDSKGRIVPTANPTATVTTDEKFAEILSVSNGDVLDHTNAKATTKKLFNGFMQIIVRAKEGSKEIKLSVNIPELGGEQIISIPVIEADKLLKLEAGELDLSIEQLRMWFGAESLADVDKKYNFADMNTSEPINLKTFTPRKEDKFFVITGKSVMLECDRKMGIKLEGVKGECVIRIDHDTNCWPNPTPPEFMTIRKEINCSTAEDIEIPLNGFSASEKFNFVIAVKNDGNFELNNILFTV